MPDTSRCDHCAHRTLPGESYCRHCGAVISVNPQEPAVPPAGSFLLVQLPGGVIRKEALRGATTRVGRGRDCEIVIDHPRVSRLHAVFELREGAWWISDSKSTGGTFVNDSPVHAPLRLRSGDTCRLGRLPGESVTIVYHEEA